MIEKPSSGMYVVVKVHSVIEEVTKTFSPSEWHQLMSIDYVKLS